LANVRTKGSVVTDKLIMQRIWALTQCIAFDASVAGAITGMFQYYQYGERLKFWVYAVECASRFCTVLGEKMPVGTVFIAFALAHLLWSMACPTGSEGLRRTR
jgi:hypothetical protein